MKGTSHQALRQRYVRMRSHALLMRISETTILLLIVTHVFMFFLDYVMAMPENRPLLHVVRIATILSCLEYLRLVKVAGGKALILAQLIHVSVVGVGAFLLHHDIGAGHSLAIPAGYLMAFAFMLTLGAPLRGPWVLVTAVTYVAVIAAACVAGHHDDTQLAIIFGFAIAVAAGLHIMTDNLAIAMARGEIDMRLKLAPLDLVRGTTLSRTDYLSFELPRQRRRCICLASDWRGYQKLSRSVPPETLQFTLGAYYDMCRDLLAKTVPSGEYFSDWIADELLIFFVAGDAEQEAEAARSALAFARALITAKAGFAAEHGIPHGIDVGLAAGAATIGLFGPRSNRKVMAVGQVAVDARRLQGLGKQLRLHRGETDRIMYSGQLHDLLGTPNAAIRLNERVALHVDAARVDVLFEEPLRLDARLTG